MLRSLVGSEMCIRDSKRAVYPVDRIVVQTTSGSTFWKTNRASPYKYYAPDPNPNPNPNHRDVYTSMWSTWCAVLSRITDTMMQVTVDTMMLFFGLGLLKQRRRSSAVISVQLNSHVCMCSDQSVPRRCTIVLTMHWTLLFCPTLCVQLLSVAVRVLSLLCACDGAMLQN